ncbi:MAG: peptide chain release factor 1 [Leptolyngbya sp. SIO4C5]|uniref:peptide chain release factor 1 n=1 Tax=Sphaerothrix gracilis TaxID=3151835 RepID=UPI0013C0DCBC|nr:peptide chain release factor 1 [Leptolyngbya sp. SIO4C5]
MRNPIERLKYLPWLILLQIAAVTAAIAALLDAVLALGLAPILFGVLAPSLPLLLPVLLFATAVGIGALAVFVFERFFQHQVLITTNVLWALVPCLGILLWLVSLLPLPSLFVGMDYFRLVGIILGIFWRGRRYR